MATVTFVEHDGTVHQVDHDEDGSLMEIATNHAVPGIEGDCGGEAACGTCHVIVTDEWAGTVGPRTGREQQMLEMSPECEANSRLACQVAVSSAMDGLKVRLPEFQM
ncbi:2Fe-2S ferredoxin [Nocardioides luteus]|uniref:Ferredoxin n=1 Tax=Nocardioides luteus TaxID=1844 RepID=A0ABQ5T5H3_9ACTN|nr:2Fe-2S iron-sulfur cluster-binding protein [Nocardioides luteus]MDR7310166.1 2Fe-2S ferredoxin [Nocardioides luteus]GGR69247.1 putative ferredoxin [Nocardioides luteus]GLJ70366.1 putative ferredoxin [Nocardioides luteus]